MISFNPKSIIVFLSIVMLDQGSKLLAGFSGLTTINTGISFALFHDVPSQIVTLAILVIATTLVVWGKQTWMKHQVIGAIFWGGVVSNLVDRIFLGGVTDWLTIPSLSVKNNIADIAIGVATILLVVVAIRDRYEHRDSI
jgi:lipoprotein signal peptidase